jgi:hypothetical protein
MIDPDEETTVEELYRQCLQGHRKAIKRVRMSISYVSYTTLHNMHEDERCEDERCEDDMCEDDRSGEYDFDECIRRVRFSWHPQVIYIAKEDHIGYIPCAQQQERRLAKERENPLRYRFLGNRALMENTQRNAEST